MADSRLTILHQVIINLVDQGGREKIIGDSYLKQVLLYNNPNLTYVSFDFHEHWYETVLRGDEGNVSISNNITIVLDLFGNLTIYTLYSPQPWYEV